MSKTQYKKLLNKHIEELKTKDIDNKLKSKHIHEIIIFPEKNFFEIGEEVEIIDNYSGTIQTGFIENLNSDGTIYIKTHFSDLGRDYSRKFVKNKNILL